MIWSVVEKTAKAGKKYHHGNLRAALIEASLQLIQEKGARALTLREVANAVGVSRMAPYRHFTNRADLLWAISEAGFAKFGDALEAAKARTPGDFASQLDAMALAYVRFSMDHQAYYEIMFSPPVQGDGEEKPHSPAGERAFRILLQTIVDGQATGEARDGDTMMLARTVWSLVHGISTLRHETDMTEQGAGARFVLFCAEILRTGLMR